MWRASITAALAADWPRLAEARGSPRRALALKAASTEPACWPQSEPRCVRHAVWLVGLERELHSLHDHRLLLLPTRLAQDVSQQLQPPGGGWG
eukprot:scaffold87649_cov52-Phaeocystis_antarctica.AAC.4